jgi:hypothetical protein
VSVTEEDKAFIVDSVLLISVVSVTEEVSEDVDASEELISVVSVPDLLTVVVGSNAPIQSLDPQATVSKSQVTVFPGAVFGPKPILSNVPELYVWLVVEIIASAVSFDSIVDPVHTLNCC